MQKNKFFHLFFILSVISGLSILFTGCTNKPSSVNDQQIEEEQVVANQIQIEIIDGNIVQIFGDGKKSVLIDKNNFETINKFTEVNLSPDKSKICFLGQSMVPIWMFYANINATNVTKVTVAKNCVWSPDSQKIAYNNHTTDVSPVNVLIYDINKKSNLNLTAKVQQSSIFRAYGIPEWSPDSTKITSQFTGIDFDNPNEKVEGSSVINLITQEIKDN
jgi:Tol biopolymer transport system component